jgi:spermidine synthase
VPEAIAGLAALALMGAFLELDVRRLASGVFRGGVARIHADQSVLFHRDGKTATVDVIDGRGSRSIRTNGKSDAAIATGTRPILDEYTMALLAILPLGHMPDARDAAVIGFGSGMSSAVLLASPTIARVDTIEIEPAMVEGAKHFRPVVDAAFDDPRSHIVIDDAKSFFARGGRKYDIVVSEPSNPWVSGVASLFTEEFYARMATYLNEGGIVAQWLHTYEMDAPTLAAIVAAASKSFPDFVIYSSVDSDVILIARKGGAPGTFDERVLAFPRLQPLLERLAMRDPEIIRRRAIADAKALLPFLRTYGMPSNSDYRPVVDHRASRTRFTKAQVRELNDLQALPVPVLEMIGAARVPSRERHENHGATFIDMATNDAWLLRDAIVGDRRWSAPDGLTPRRASAHLLREWGACRTSLGFEDMLPALVDVAEVVNTRLHPAVSAQVWQSLGASPCAKALAPAQRRWLTLLDAIGRRDARVMAEQAQAIIDASHAARPPSEALDTAFFAGVTGLACSGRREAARAFLERGMGDASQPLPARQSAVRLFDAITRDPMPACREAT